MAKLVFQGHETRGKELHKLLEYLGGVVAGYGECSCVTCYYYINREGYIEGSNKVPAYMINRIITTLEEFESKYPYKVGDKVIDMNGLHGTIATMSWDECNCTVRYTFKDDEVGTNHHGYTALMLKPYIVDTGCCSFPTTEPSYTLSVENVKDMKRSIIFGSDSPNETELVLGDNFEIQVKDGKNYVVRKKPQYPKTYIECAKLLDCFSAEYIDGYKNELLEKLQELLICRDAYWKIAGEKNKGNIDYVICNVGGKIIRTDIPNSAYNHILTFPTEEMRDAFYENFKELIQQCKELL